MQWSDLEIRTHFIILMTPSGSSSDHLCFVDGETVTLLVVPGHTASEVSEPGFGPRQSGAKLHRLDPCVVLPAP